MHLNPVPITRRRGVAALACICAAGIAAAETQRISLTSAGATIRGEFAFLAGDSSRAAFVTTSGPAGESYANTQVCVREFATNTTLLASIGADGQPADADCSFPILSGNGRFVVFVSAATNLVSPGGATNGHTNIWVRDLVLNTTTRLTVADGGGPPDGPSGAPAVSSTGQFVAFESRATNLLAGLSPTVTQVYVRDRGAPGGDGSFGAGGTTTLVSFRTTFSPATLACFQPAISGDGRFVAFTSQDSGLVANDTNGQFDVFVRDLQTNTTARVSVRPGGAQTAGVSQLPSISADGRYVAFRSADNGLDPTRQNTTFAVFVRDRGPGLNDVGAVTRNVAVNSAGIPANGSVAADINERIAMTPDGRFVAFRSSATNLVADDTNTFADVFVHDRDFDADGVFDGDGAIRTSRANVASDGGQTINADSFYPSLSNFGARVAFHTLAGGLLPGDPPLAPQARAYVHCSGPVLEPGPADQTVPLGNPAQFTVQLARGIGVRFQWRKNGGAINDDGRITGTQTPTLRINPTQAGDEAAYSVEVENECGSARSDEGMLAFGDDCDAPQVTSQPAGQTLCAGDSLSLTVTAVGTAPLTYEWRRSGTLIPDQTGPMLQINATTPADSGTYQVTVRNACGSDLSASVSVVVRALPTILVHPTSQSACPGASVTFSVSATTTFGMLGYQWRRNGINIAGANGATLTRSGISTADVGEYDCVVSNPCGSITSDAASLTIAGLPSITSQPAGQTICVGRPFTLAVTATGLGTLRFQWLRNNTAVSGGSAATFTRASATAADAGSYTCRVSNNCGSVVSDAAVLVLGQAPAITAQPRGTSACPGGSASFTIAANGQELTFRWRRGTTELADGGHISGVNSPELVISPVSPADAAISYNCVVTGVCASVTSNNVALTVASAPSIQTQPTNRTAAIGASVTFSLIATGTAPLTFQWRKDGSNLPGATTSSLTINPVQQASAAGYDCVVTNNCGSVTSNVATLTINTSPPPGNGSGPPVTPPSTTCGVCGAAAPQGAIATVVAMILSRSRRRRRGRRHDRD